MNGGAAFLALQSAQNSNKNGGDMPGCLLIPLFVFAVVGLLICSAVLIGGIFMAITQ